MIGLLITSFLQGKVNPIMTSTICNLCAEHATVGSKTGYCKECHGVILSSNRGGVKTVGGRVLRVANDALPYELRPIKSRRRRVAKRWGWRVELYTFRRVWHSHYKYKIKNKLNSLI